MCVCVCGVCVCVCVCVCVQFTAIFLSKFSFDLQACQKKRFDLTYLVSLLYTNSPPPNGGACSRKIIIVGSCLVHP